MNVLAIDPGSKESAFVLWDGEIASDFGKVENDVLLYDLSQNMWAHDVTVIEQVRSYGMPVGAEIFDTVHWSGRFHQASWVDVILKPRKDVKMHLCNTNRAKDSNIIQALVDRFAYGQKNKGKGTKKEPGFFYGFKSDIWQAFALAVTYYDKKHVSPCSTCSKLHLDTDRICHRPLTTLCNGDNNYLYYDKK